MVTQSIGPDDNECLPRLSYSDTNDGKNRFAFYMQTNLNINTELQRQWSKAVLHLRIAATSIPEYVSSWCRPGFESLSQPLLLT